MPRYKVPINIIKTHSVWEFIEADNPEEAKEKAEELLRSEDYEPCLNANGMSEVEWDSEVDTWRNIEERPESYPFKKGDLVMAKNFSDTWTGPWIVYHFDRLTENYLLKKSDDQYWTREYSPQDMKFCEKEISNEKRP